MDDTTVPIASPMKENFNTNAKIYPDIPSDNTPKNVDNVGEVVSFEAKNVLDKTFCQEKNIIPNTKTDKI